MSSVTKLYEDILNHGFDPLKTLISNVDALYNLSTDKQQELKFCLIRQTFEHHYQNNPYYRGLCDEKNISPKDIKSFADLILIPLIPIQVYKSADNFRLLSKSPVEVEHEMRSTGTSGVPSIYRRCYNTMDYTVLAVISNYRSMFKISSGAGLFLCPSPEDIPEMAMVKIFNFMAGLLDTSYYGITEVDKFEPQQSIDQLTKWQNKFTRHIVGPPFLIHRLTAFLKENNIKLTLDKESLVMMMGGWKRFTGMMISREELDQDIQEWLGIPPSRVRDMYGMVEANFMAIEDEFNHKHVPPYIHFSVRDPNDPTKELPDGETGLLAVLDPLSQSTPTMVLTEDLVYIRTDPSKSWRNSQRVEFVMRTPAAKEFGCCAVNLEKNMDSSDQDVADK